MDKRLIDQIVEIHNDAMMHSKNVLNWDSEGKVHLTEEFFMQQFFKSDYTEKILYTWFGDEGGLMDCSITYRNCVFFALIKPVDILKQLIYIKKSE